MKRTSLLFLFFALSCATAPQGAYLFPRGKQKHEVHVYSKDGTENFSSQSFLVIDEKEARITALSPVALTMMKAELHKGQAPIINYLNPALAKHKGNIELFLKKLSHLLWIRQGNLSSEMKVIDLQSDGTAKDIEWKFANQKILIRIEKI